MSDYPNHDFFSWGGNTARGVLRKGSPLGKHTKGARLSVGLGRSYNDAALPARASDVLLNTTEDDKLQSFDEASGVLNASAGISLATLAKVFLPRGFFVPVTPGTQFVTLGGAIASDVHGKNHHRAGTIGRHIRSLVLDIGRDAPLTCSRTQNTDLFLATLGGMGLTGHILSAQLAMEPIESPWIVENNARADNVEEFLELLQSNAEHWPFTVGWIDCLSKGRALGRGVLMRGRWAKATEGPKTVPQFSAKMSLPVTAPNWALGKLSVRMFNESYFRMQHTGSERIASPYSFFYPLDAVRSWNRMYGSRGFSQYQCVIPRAAGTQPIVEILEKLASTGDASFLCVLKDFGPCGDGTLSFPMKGTTLAIDLPNKAHSAELFGQLNRVTIKSGGRIYLAKDSYTTAKDFSAMEGARLEQFQSIREKWGLRGRFSSALSRRLLGE